MYSSIYCGDGIVEKNRGEVCDLGQTNGYPGYNCSVTCQILIVAGCGNGLRDATEECDDGNLRDFDGCSAQCLSEVGSCGNGTIQKGFGEECDDGANNGADESLCDIACKKKVSPFCGDSSLNADVGEECDEGPGNTDERYTTCLTSCQLPACGDGLLENDEQCDDGNLFAWDMCDYACQIEGGVGAAGTDGGQYAGQLLQGQGGQYGRIPTPARTATGPGFVIFLASGAAAGIGLMRRRYFRSK